MAKKILRAEFKHLPEKVNWFPGHMRKAMKDLGDEFKKVNLFIEVRDARIPMTSRNESLHEILPPTLKRIVVYNKMDLANQKHTMNLIKEMHESETAIDKKLKYLHTSSKSNVNINKLL